MFQPTMTTRSPMEGMRILAGRSQARNMGTTSLAAYISTGDSNRLRIKGFISWAPIVRAKSVRLRSTQFSTMKETFSLVPLRKVRADDKIPAIIKLETLLIPYFRPFSYLNEVWLFE